MVGSQGHSTGQPHKGEWGHAPLWPRPRGFVASAWVNSSNSFAWLPRSHGDTAVRDDSSIQWPPLLTRRPRSATSPSAHR